MESRFRHSAEEIRRQVENLLFKTGLLCRVFARGKDEHSLNKKLSREKGKYSTDGKKIQDVIGVRVVLYFEEDVDIVENILSSEFEVDTESSTKDSHATDQFTVTRHNLVFKIPTQYRTDFIRIVGKQPIDNTFEVQLRTVLSEGWHEVDHDLRYKSKTGWTNQDDLSRALNGILATIETAEWGMRQIFDELAFRHYKQGNWATMLHNKVRMRVAPQLSDELLALLDQDRNFAKELFRMDRKKLIYKISKLIPSIPLSLDNIIYIWNSMGPKNEEIHKITPKLIIESLTSNEEN